MISVHPKFTTFILYANCMCVLPVTRLSYVHDCKKIGFILYSENTFSFLERVIINSPTIGSGLDPYYINL